MGENFNPQDYIEGGKKALGKNDYASLKGLTGEQIKQIALARIAARKEEAVTITKDQSGALQVIDLINPFDKKIAAPVAAAPVAAAPVAAAPVAASEVKKTPDQLYDDGVNQAMSYAKSKGYDMIIKPYNNGSQNQSGQYGLQMVLTKDGKEYNGIGAFPTKEYAKKNNQISDIGVALKVIIDTTIKYVGEDQEQQTELNKKYGTLLDIGTTLLRDANISGTLSFGEWKKGSSKQSAMNTEIQLDNISIGKISEGSGLQLSDSERIENIKSGIQKVVNSYIQLQRQGVVANQLDRPSQTIINETWYKAEDQAVDYAKTKGYTLSVKETGIRAKNTARRGINPIELQKLTLTDTSGKTTDIGTILPEKKHLGPIKSTDELYAEMKMLIDTAIIKITAANLGSTVQSGAASIGNSLVSALNSAGQVLQNVVRPVGEYSEKPPELSGAARDYYIGLNSAKNNLVDASSYMSNTADDYLKQYINSSQGVLTRREGAREVNKIPNFANYTINMDGEKWNLTESPWYKDQYPGPDRPGWNHTHIILWSSDKTTQVAFPITDVFPASGKIDVNRLRAKINEAKGNKASESRDEAGARSFDLPKDKKIGYISLVQKSSDTIVDGMKTGDLKYFPELLRSKGYKMEYKSPFIEVHEGQNTKSIIQSQIDDFKSKGIKEIYLSLSGHGDQNAVYFGSSSKSPKMSRDDFMAMLRENPTMNFTINTIACHGGGLESLLGSLNKVAPNQEVRIFAQAKDSSFNQEGRVANGTDKPTILSTYYNIYFQLALGAGMTYGQAHIEADMQAKKMSGSDATMLKFIDTGAAETKGFLSFVTRGGKKE